MQPRGRVAYGFLPSLQQAFSKCGVCGHAGKQGEFLYVVPGVFVKFSICLICHRKYWHATPTVSEVALVGKDRPGWTVFACLTLTAGRVSRRSLNTEVTEVRGNLFAGETSQIITKRGKTGILQKQNIFILETVVLTLPPVVAGIINRHVPWAFIYVYSLLRNTLHHNLLILPSRRFTHMMMRFSQRVHWIVSTQERPGVGELLPSRNGRLQSATYDSAG